MAGAAVGALYKDHKASQAVVAKFAEANRLGIEVIDKEFTSRYGTIDDSLDNPVALGLFRGHLERQLDAKLAEAKGKALSSKVLKKPMVDAAVMPPMFDPDDQDDDKRKDKSKKPETQEEHGVAEPEASKPEKIKLSKPAKEVVQENPYVTRDYARDIEEKTGRKIPGNQLARLRVEMQKQEFEKLGTQEGKLHRAGFENKVAKDALRAEWEKQTGQKWPTYEDDVYNKKGEKIKSKGENYDMHHIIHNSHGGTHEWWNMHPASIEEHQAIHGKGSVARQIFNQSTKK